MYELEFQPAAFRGHVFGGSFDRAALAREVVAALVRGGGVRDAERLTNAAFLVEDPLRELRGRPNPVREPAAAMRWHALYAGVVLPALVGAGARGVAAVAASAARAVPAPGAAPRGGPILLVGDSHTHGAFGAALERLLEAGGAAVERHAQIGSAVKYWLPRVPALLREHRPGTVIIALGANMRDYRSAAGTSAQVRELVAAIRAGAPGARLVWIGPPRRAGDTADSIARFNGVIRAGLDRAALFVDSAPHTPVYRGADGVHYAARAAEDWARGVFTEVR